jgi:hypothetical protein
MKTTIVTIIALLSLSTVAYAASEARKPKPVACEGFSVLKGDSGTYAVCPSAKEGGKPSLLRSFAVVSVTDPDGKAVKLAVGFR